MFRTSSCSSETPLAPPQTWASKIGGSDTEDYGVHRISIGAKGEKYRRLSRGRFFTDSQEADKFMFCL